MKRKKIAHYISVGMVAVMMMGCTSGAKLAPKFQPLKTIPDHEYICRGSACSSAWARTQLWINRHSLMKIRMANDSLIQTYSSIRHRYSFTATKDPIGNNAYRIRLEIGGVSPYTYGSSLLVEKSLYYYPKTGRDLLIPRLDGVFISEAIK
jgi:hypothetical protein